MELQPGVERKISAGNRRETKQSDPHAARRRERLAPFLRGDIPVTGPEIQLVSSQMAAALRESETRYQALFNNATEAIFIHDLDGVILEVNRAACERLGYTAAELTGAPFEQVEVPELRALIPMRIALIQQHKAISFESVHQSRAGELIPVEVNARMIEYEGRAAVLSEARDITDRKRAELELVNANQALAGANEALASANEALAGANEALRESEQKFRSLVASSPDGIALVDGRGQVVEMNQAGEMIFGVSAEIARGSRVDALIPGGVPPAGGEAVERALLRPDGESRIIQAVAFPIPAEGETRCGIVIRDVTAQRLVERELETYHEGLEVMVAERTAQLQHEIRERQAVEQNLEAMLREIHHRVKNNLNVIISLIDLQKDGQSDPRVLQVFQELQARAYTMSLVHESLYRSPDLARVDFSGYLQTLLAYLQSVYGPSGPRGGVVLRVEAAHAELKIEAAIPCGLIVNELVTNALKYAFPPGADRGGAQPEVVVSLARDGEGAYTLTVSDNGVGLPPGFAWQSAQTLGLQLVQVLARQLGGRVSLAPPSPAGAGASAGAAWHLRFEERR